MNAAYLPTRAAALARIVAVRPADYARSRNAIDGAVTGLSPYITHGLVTLPEVLDGVVSQHRIDVQHKFVFELGWREFFRHVWEHRGEAILRSLHAGPLPDEAYAQEMPADIRQARTGVPVIDLAVRTLYATGLLHNHARMWLASYVVHLRKVHWRVGADWLYAHLLDGDLASNHLSWQWVAGTGSSKPYLFNADNVARFAPTPWHSSGSVIDLSYDALDVIARSQCTVPFAADREGVAEPTLLHRPPRNGAAHGPAAVELAGRDVWLVHPWALDLPPHDLPVGCLCVGLLLSDFHDVWPWSPMRWDFVSTRMAELAPQCLTGSGEGLALALAGARSVQTLADPHIDSLMPSSVIRRPALRLFAEVERPCASFSQWWTRAVRGARDVHALPGLTTWVHQKSSAPIVSTCADTGDVKDGAQPKAGS